jgi:hypothetical protein
MVWDLTGKHERNARNFVGMKSSKDRQIYGDCEIPQSSVDDELTPWVEEQVHASLLNGLSTKRASLAPIVPRKWSHYNSSGC